MEENSERKDFIYVCAECSVEFNDLDGFTAHLPMHAEEKTEETNREHRMDTQNEEYDNDNQNEEYVEESAVNMSRILVVEPDELDGSDNSRDIPSLMPEDVNQPHYKKKIYMCAECGRSFAVKSLLMRHLKVHNGDKPYECPTCKKCFAQSGGLKVHMRTHGGPGTYGPMYSCSVCGKIFNYSNALTRHMKVHTGEKPHMCAVCHKTFTQSYNLKIHMQTVHRDKCPPIEEKVYTCPECGKCFSCNTSLSRHKKVHTGEKPYECLVCGKSFAQSYSLKVHMKIHGSDIEAMKHRTSVKTNRDQNSSAVNTANCEKIYMCSECGVSFPEKCLCVRHITVHNVSNEDAKCGTMNVDGSGNGESQVSTLTNVVNNVNHEYGTDGFQAVYVPGSESENGEMANETIYMQLEELESDEIEGKTYEKDEAENNGVIVTTSYSSKQEVHASNSKSVIVQSPNLKKDNTQTNSSSSKTVIPSSCVKVINGVTYVELEDSMLDYSDKNEVKTLFTSPYSGQPNNRSPVSVFHEGKDIQTVYVPSYNSDDCEGNTEIIYEQEANAENDSANYVHENDETTQETVVVSEGETQETVVLSEGETQETVVVSEGETQETVVVSEGETIFVAENEVEVCDRQPIYVDSVEIDSGQNEVYAEVLVMDES